MFQLLRYYAPYKKNLALAVLCNLLMSVFMVVSIPVLQPFLQILFNRESVGAALPKDSGFSGFELRSKQFFNGLIADYGQEKALILVCILLVGVFFGKNLFRYLSLYFLAPVRNGIVRDFRQKNGE
jgi:ABC-type multidrug transport system fused ATPase/permease subunit